MLTIPSCQIAFFSSAPYNFYQSPLQQLGRTDLQVTICASLMAPTIEFMPLFVVSLENAGLPGSITKRILEDRYGQPERQ